MSPQSLGFSLFVVCTGVLFVRPTELVESLNDVPVYEVAILGCLAISGPRLLKLLISSALHKQPGTICVLGLLLAVAMSHVSQLAVGLAAMETWAFFKVVVSYLLLVAVLNTTDRLRRYLRWLFVFLFGLTVLALLQHYGAIDNPALAAHYENVFDKDSGDVVDIDVRLCGAGIFANPNDLSRILVVGIALSVYFFDGGAPALLRPVWVATVGLFGHALLLTMSRGGFIDLLVTLLVLCFARLGARRTVFLAGVMLPILTIAVEGRQTDLSTMEGTGQQRIRLWSDGLDAMQSSPLFGTGKGTYPEIGGGLGAHNSFVETYVELGFFGGTLFVVAVSSVLWMCALMGRRDRQSPPELSRFRPYALAILAGYMAGMLTSSRCYAIPTYLLLGLVVVYLRLARADLLLPSLRVTPRAVLWATGFSVLVLAAIKIYVLSAVQFSTKL